MYESVSDVNPQQNVSQFTEKIVMTYIFVAPRYSRSLPSRTGTEKLFFLGTGGQ